MVRLFYISNLIGLFDDFCPTFHWWDNSDIRVTSGESVMTELAYTEYSNQILSQIYSHKSNVFDKRQLNDACTIGPASSVSSANRQTISNPTLPVTARSSVWGKNNKAKIK